jgi:hypothetical protein
VLAHLPNSLRRYFWDADTQKFSVKKQSNYIAERLLELAGVEALRWLEKTYGKAFLANLVKKSRFLSTKSANFYALHYHLKPESILCLRKDSPAKLNLLWPH